MHIRQAIEQQIYQYGNIGFPCPMERFILRNGKEFSGLPFRNGSRWTKKECFKNATEHTALGEYHEGYVIRPDLPILIHHAWIVQKGKVIDGTIDRPEECEYMGVHIPYIEVLQEIKKNGVYGVLDTGAGINMKFLYQKDGGLRNEIEKVIGQKADHFRIV